MEDKAEIAIGVVYDYDGMKQACHRLRAIQAGIEGLSTKLWGDGSSAYEGLSFALNDIIKWLAPDNAVRADSMACKHCGHKQKLSPDVELWDPADPSVKLYFCRRCGVICLQNVNMNTTLKKKERINHGRF